MYATFVKYLVLLVFSSPFLWSSYLSLTQFAPFARCCYCFNFNVFFFVILRIFILAKVLAVGHEGSLNATFTCNNCKLRSVNFQGSGFVEGSNRIEKRRRFCCKHGVAGLWFKLGQICDNQSSNYKMMLMMMKWRSCVPSRPNVRGTFMTVNWSKGV